MSALMDSAVFESSRLGLELGEGLSEEQIANLDHDILWLEKIEIEGQTVLAPRLYLSKKTLNKTSNHAAGILANNLTIKARNLNNSGQIVGGLSQIELSGSLLNAAGKISSPDNLSITAIGDITNKSGTISGKNITLAAGGNITNETVVIRDGSGNNFVDTYGDTATISAENTANIFAGGDVDFIGGKASAGGNLNITAGGDVNMLAQYKTRSAKFGSKDDSYESTETKAKVSELSAGNINISAGNDANFEGTKLTATNNIKASAGGDLNIYTAQESSYEASSFSNDGGTFGSKFSLERSKSDLTNKGAQFTAGGDVNLTAGQNLVVIAAKADAGGDVKLRAGEQVYLGTTKDAKSSYSKQEESGMLGGFFSKSSITETKSSEDVEITIVNSINDIVTSSGDDTIIKATSLTAGGNIEVSVGVDADGNIINPTAQFKILTDKGKEYLSVQTYDSGFIKYTITDKGYESEAIVHALINSGGDFVINAPGGVLAEYKHTGDFKEDIAQLSLMPGLEYLAELENNPDIDVDWQKAEETYRTWDESQSGMAGPMMAVIAIVISIVSFGSASALAAGMMGMTLSSTGALVGATVGPLQIAMHAALTAGISSLTVQVGCAVADAAVGGDLGNNLEDIISSDGLKSLATAMVSAGVISYANHLAGLDNAATGIDAAGNNTAEYKRANEIIDNLKRHTISAGIRSGAEALIEGESFTDSLRDNFRYAGASFLNETISAEIGQAFGGNDPNRTVQLMAHAALGCAVGEVAGGDCSTTAIGQVAGELSAIIYGNATFDGTVEELKGIDPNSEQFEVITQRWIDDGVDIARITAALASALAGADADGVNLGSNAGGTAARNNAIGCTIAAIVALASLAYTTWQGDGNIIDGADKIIAGKDIASEVVTSLFEEGRDIAYAISPEGAERVFSALEDAGDIAETTVTYWDDASGNYLSSNWNNLSDKEQQNIKRSGFFLGIASGPVLSSLSKTYALSNAIVKVDLPDGGKVGNKGNSSVLNGTGNLSDLMASKSLGWGSTGRVTPNSLEEQLAMKNVLSDPFAGNYTILDKIPMNDDRWKKKDGWVKAQRIITTDDKTAINIHFIYNQHTGDFDDFKFKSTTKPKNPIKDPMEIINNLGKVTRDGN